MCDDTSDSTIDGVARKAAFAALYSAFSDLGASMRDEEGGQDEGTEQ